MMRRDVIFLCKVMLSLSIILLLLSWLLYKSHTKTIFGNFWVFDEEVELMFWLSLSLSLSLSRFSRIFFCNMKTFCLFQRRRNAPIFENISKIAQFWRKRKTRHTLLPFYILFWYLRMEFCILKLIN